MTMAFRNVAAALVTTLGAAAASQYRVVGYQQQSVGATETEGTDRLVQVFYAGGSFPKSSGSVTGSRNHEARFNLELRASAGTSTDISRLDDPTSDDRDRAEVLAETTAAEAAKRANDSWDELMELVYQVLADPQNRDLGLSDLVGSLWISRTQKDAPAATGGLVTVTGIVELTCNLEEVTTGATPTPADGGVDVTKLIVYNQDGVTVDNSKAGALVD